MHDITLLGQDHHAGAEVSPLEGMRCFSNFVNGSVSVCLSVVAGGRGGGWREAEVDACLGLGVRLRATCTYSLACVFCHSHSHWLSGLEA